VTGERRWWWRVLAAALVLAVTEAIAGPFVEWLSEGATHTDVDHLRLALVVAVVVAAAGLVVDAAHVESVRWHVVPERGDAQGSADPRTAAYLRVLESHMTSRDPGPALRDRIGDLADQVLELRHGLDRTDPGAWALLGPELQRVLTEPPRRLDPDEVERCVRRIEDL
jgi:hypothetical protein